jgi:hypothetical protein
MITKSDYTSQAKNALKHLRNYCVPYNLELPAMINDFGANPFWLTDKGLEPLYFVISYILRKYSHKDAELGQFVNISAELMRERFGTTNKLIGKKQYLNVPAIELLTSLGIIQFNPKYSNGANAFCMSYRLTKSFCTTIHKTISYGFRSNPKEVNKLLDKIKKPVFALPVMDAIYENIGRMTLMENQYIKMVEEIGDNDSLQCRMKYAMQDFLNGSYRIKLGTNQNRVYHVLNTSPTEFRSCFSLNGEELVEVDIRACQPVLLLSLCKNWELPEVEIEDYKKVLSGDFYSELSPETTRDEAKDAFLKFAFYQYAKHSPELVARRIEASPLARAFVSRFPSIAALIIKRSKKLQTLSSYLQNFESEICIYTVGDTLAKNGIFFVPIHDGYMCRKEEAAYIADLIKAEILKQLNFIPVVCLDGSPTP